jgi:hypothetical protein
MSVSCSRKGNLFEQAEQLMEAAAKKVELSRASGSSEVAI